MCAVILILSLDDQFSLTVLVSFLPGSGSKLRLSRTANLRVFIQIRGPF